jgi:hypothetical protein
VPTDGKEFKWGDNEPRAWDIPEPEKYDGIYEYLSIRLNRVYIEKGQGKVGRPTT